MLRPSILEKLLLNKPNFTIDTGVALFKMSFGVDYWKLLFPKRTKATINSIEMKTLKLRETESGNRLTVDKGAKKIELAASATEIEREWLFGYLSDNYS